MVDHRTTLPRGSNVLEEPIERCHIDGYVGNLDLAKLSLTLESPQTKDNQRLPATTLAIYLKREAAMKLLVDLHSLSNAMGWPIQNVIGT